MENEIELKDMNQVLNETSNEIQKLIVEDSMTELEAYLKDFFNQSNKLFKDLQIFQLRLLFSLTILKITQHLNIESDVRSFQSMMRLINQINLAKHPSHFTEYIDNFIREINGINKNRLANKGHYVDRAVILIDQHKFEEGFSVQWLADRLGISTTHLGNLFKSANDQSISAYIHAEKIKDITDDLKYSSLSLKEVREKYGFESASYFSQFFKKAMGKTPLHYMKAHR